MATLPGNVKLRDISEELRKRRRTIAREQKERALWFIRMRWWVPPCIAAASGAGLAIGVKFAVSGLLAVACFILAYNAFFLFWSKSFGDKTGGVRFYRRFTTWQAAIDYAAMFLLIHFTGGAASPLIFFFVFHIIFTAILLTPKAAYSFAAIASIGMCAIVTAEYNGLVPNHSLVIAASAIDLAKKPPHIAVELLFFAAAVFITAFTTTSIMGVLRKRVVALADLSEEVTALNKRLNTINSITKAIISSKRLDEALNIVTGGMAALMEVKAISIKLLSEDGMYLKYAAARGLPEDFLSGAVIEVAKSRINRRILEGEPFVTGRVTQEEMFQFGENLADAGVQSALFVPLVTERKVVGVLGAYSERPERFGEADVEFFRLCAGMVAIAIENAQSFESIEKLIRDRSWFMMKVAHNMRAPLAAMLSMLDVALGGYIGDVNKEQREYLRRIERRARAMITLINELLILAKERGAGGGANITLVDLSIIARGLLRTFQDGAAEKGLQYSVDVNGGLPEIPGDPEMIEQMLENLVSNSVKYTPSGGSVRVVFSPGSANTVRIEVTDTGIGIPKEEQPKLYTEFFRASNARGVEETGTGLGLAIVKEVVARHGGSIFFESEEGRGASFVVNLPASGRE